MAPRFWPHAWVAPMSLLASRPSYSEACFPLRIAEVRQVVLEYLLAVNFANRHKKGLRRWVHWENGCQLHLRISMVTVLTLEHSLSQGPDFQS